MGIGPIIRRAFGPLEPRIADAYRRAFFDMSSLGELVARRSPRRILEIGCGEGATATALLSATPDARYVGIDISPDAGRLFSGPRERAEFHTAATATFAATHAGAFDTVVMCDVLHHVPRADRPRFLRDAAALLDRGGVFFLKEWERRPTPVHFAVWFSDRFITGDQIAFATAGELRALLSTGIPELALESEHRLPPWQNNLVFVLRK